MTQTCPHPPPPIKSAIIEEINVSRRNEEEVGWILLLAKVHIILSLGHDESDCSDMDVIKQ